MVDRYTQIDKVMGSTCFSASASNPLDVNGETLVERLGSQFRDSNLLIGSNRLSYDTFCRFGCVHLNCSFGIKSQEMQLILCCAILFPCIVQYRVWAAYPRLAFPIPLLSIGCVVYI